MMTRLWPASMVLALLLGAGQALADNTPCKYSNVTFDSSAKTITVTCAAASGTPSATLSNKQTSCTYSAISITGSTGAVDATCVGAGPSSGASFTISSAANSVTVGTPLSLIVTRSKGAGALGADTLTLNSSATNSSATDSSFFNPSATVSFGLDEQSGATRTPRVVFTKTGLVSLSGTSTGGTANLLPITVVKVGTCSGIPVPPYAADAGAADSDMGDHRLIAASASERAAGTVRFTAPASGSLTFTVSAPATGYPALSSLDMTVSACPGDFSPSSSACKVPGSNSKGVKITVGAADCAVQASQPYYLNLRSVTPGRDVGLHLGAQ